MCKQSSLLIVLLLSSLFSIAQNYVTLHDQCNYAGRQYTLEAGSFRAYQIKIDNDKLSSIQIPDGWKVTIFENDKFEGRSATYTSNINCLDASWRNMTSSIIVESAYNNQPGYGQNDYITFYTDCYTKGYSQSLRPGTYSGIQLASLKNNISSFVITGNLQVRVYLNSENLNGASALLEASQTCLSSGYNDKIGSLIIEYKPNQYNNPSYPSGGGAAGGSGSFATLYTDCNYNGNAVRLMPGTYQGDKLGLLKYNASSIQLSSNLRARVYLDNEYLSGTSYLIDIDNNCMNSNLRNRIGSVVIEERSGNSNNNQYQQPSNQTVIIYTDGNYKGQAATLLPGTYSTMAEANFPDDALSSLVIPTGFRVVLYEYANFKGKSYTVTESKTGFTFSGWNDRASSISVFRN